MKLNKYIKKFFLLTLALFASPFFSATALKSEELVQVGEDIIYEVSYMGIKLGSVRIITEPAEKVGNQEVIKAKGIIKSYDGIPFFYLYTTYESWINPSISYSHKFVGNTKFMSDPWNYQSILFDYDKTRIVNEQWENKVLKVRDTMFTKSKWNDGLSLFFFARKYTDAKKSIKIPTFINEDTSYTQINFSGKRDQVNIDAVDYPIKTIFFTGSATWEGIYGITGKFEGWFSDDDARVPIKAKMKTIIGNVDIELIKWTRKGWTPPKA
jgi:hypothetical protein